MHGEILQRRLFLKAGLLSFLSGPTLDISSRRRILAEHKLLSIESRVLKDRYPRLVGKNARRGYHGRGGSYKIRVLTTDKGIQGWGMSHGSDQKVKKFIGAKISEIFDPAYGTAHEAHLLDIPLHDLAAKILSLPVWKLLGGRGPQKIPIYSGAIYFDDLEPPNAPRGVQGVIEACLQDYALGYRAFKLKIGRGYKWMPKKEGLKRDIEVTRAVREKFPDCLILVDANDGYTLEEAKEYVKAVSDCGLYWIEEPFVEETDKLRRLRDYMEKVNCKAMIADGEARRERAKEWWLFGGYSKPHIERLFSLAEKKLVAVFVLDLGTLGFTNWRKIMPKLERHAVKASPHTWGWIPRPYYAAQLAAGLGNVPIVEGIPGKTKGVDYSAYRFEKGKIVIPSKPGFGLELL